MTMTHANDLPLNVLEGDVGAKIEVKDHYLLVRAIELPEKMGGLIIPEQTRNEISIGQPLARVIHIGAGCFDDVNKFPLGPRCQVGDWIHYSLLERYKAPIFSHNYYYLYDERVISVVPMDALQDTIKDFHKYFPVLTS